MQRLLYSLRLIVPGILIGFGWTTAFAANQAYDYVRNLTDYERAGQFAQIVNNNPDLDYCRPSHTEFLGMKSDERAGYLLVCDTEEYLALLYPDKPRSVIVQPCFVAYMMGENCREMWDDLDFFLELLEDVLE